MLAIFASLAVPEKDFASDTMAAVRIGPRSSLVEWSGVAPDFDGDETSSISKASGHLGTRSARLQKKRNHEGDGPPPDNRVQWAISNFPPWDASLAIENSDSLWLGNPSTFVPQGMQPEQGGQTGPPREPFSQA